MRLNPLADFGLTVGPESVRVSRGGGLPMLPGNFGIPVTLGGNIGERGVWLVTRVEFDDSDHRLSFILSTSAIFEVVET